MSLTNNLTFLCIGDCLRDNFTFPQLVLLSDAIPVWLIFYTNAMRVVYEMLYWWVKMFFELTLLLYLLALLDSGLNCSEFTLTMRTPALVLAIIIISWRLWLDFALISQSSSPLDGWCVFLLRKDLTILKGVDFIPPAEGFPFLLCHLSMNLL